MDPEASGGINAQLGWLARGGGVLLAVFLVAGASSVSGSADEPAGVLPAQSTTAPLTLAEAVALAARNNELSGIATARLDRARALRRQAYSALLPDFSFAGTYTRRSSEVTRIVDDEKIVVQAIDAFSGVATIETNILDVRAFPVARSATRNLEAQEHASAEIRRALAFDVASSFFAILSAERLREAASRRIEVAQATVSDARTRLEAGLASSNDLTRAELELASAQLALTQAQNAVVDSRLSLGYLIAAPVVDRPLAEPPAEPADSASPEELEQIAQEARADLRELTLRAESLRLLALEPELRVIPTLTLRGTYRGTNEAGLSGRERDWNVAALLNWEIFDGGTRYAEGAARRAEYREALLNADALRRRIGLEIRTARTDLATARASLDQAEVRARVAEQNAREVRVRYSEGLATALEQADATVSAFEAAAELARQRFALGIAQLSLSRALGRWPVAATTPSEPGGAGTPERLSP
ncbi:MAG TPA: TolC family protein [Thermoanaerobaculia bacterium]|nr:TolC family protein [Thermoanaerobaculia bacterium]